MTRQIRLGAPGRPVEPGSLYEVPTQAFALQRPRPSHDPLRAVRETARPPGRVVAAAAPAPAPSPASDPEFGEFIPVLIASAPPTVGPPRPAAQPEPEPVLAVAAQQPPRSLRSPPSRRPRPSRAPSRLRALAARLWRFFGR